MKNIKRIFSKFIPKRSILRRNLDQILYKLFKKLKQGIVLDIGSAHSPYKNKIPYKKYLTMDINPSNNPDICSDIHNIKSKSKSFDTVIATEMLEHVRDPRKAVSELHRVLKPQGSCILSTCFFFRYHPNPKDYYRFTQDSLRDLFRKFSKVKIYPYGNRIHLIWHIVNRGNLILKLFTPLVSKIKFNDKEFPTGFVVYAIK